jgi:hypothetical protein
MKHVLKTLVITAAAIAVCGVSIGATQQAPAAVLSVAPSSVPSFVSATPPPATIIAVAPVKSALSAQPITKVVPVDPPVAAAVDSRQAYLNAMYLSVIPAGERAALDGRYVFGHDLPGLSCGTGCTNLFGNQARSSFDAAFFAESLPYQRNTLAHEVAHAYGFLNFADYATPSWAGMTGWRAQFHAADQAFVGTYDAEAWADCVAWKDSGFNNRVDQVRAVCTEDAAAIAMASIH